jgi:hypothetical protein
MSLYISLKLKEQNEKLQLQYASTEVKFIAPMLETEKKEG